MHHSYIDRFAQGDSPIHRLDARAKLLAVVAYTVVLTSFDRYAVSELAAMSIFPLAMLWLGRVPLWFGFRRALVLSPFIATVALLSTFYDHSVHTVAMGPWQLDIPGGYLTAADVIAKFTLGILALTAMMCTTPFGMLLEAMRRLAAPRALVMQLGFLYRYIFVLLDEAMRIRRARDFRGSAQAPLRRRLAATGGVIGSLFVLTLDRSERIHRAMCARGYRGEPHSLTRLRAGWADAVFLLLTAAHLVLARWLYPAYF